MERMNEQKIRKICNICVIVIFGISVVMLLKYSSIPNVFNISFMEKPDNPSSIGMSLYTSFVVTAVFYFLMNYIPDLLKAKEQEKKELPKRIAIQRDIQLFLARYFCLWRSIVIFTEIDKKSNKIYSVNEMFDDDFIKNRTAQIPMLGQSNACNPSGDKVVWKEYIHNELSDIINRGNKILEVYTGELSEDVHFYLNYLIKEDEMLRELHKHIQVFYNGISEQNSLFDLIGKKGDGTLDLTQTRKCLNFLYNWVNSEYDYIISKGGAEYSDRIFRIDIRG